ncbi:MAG: GreA/GreB family elongation factor, partial [Planctomycetota bacterium]
MSPSIPMTPEGYAKLKAEADQLEKRRPGIKEAIETAREKGDLRENADYHAAREELAMLNARVEGIHGKLANAVVVDPAKAPKGKAVLGSTVK